MPTHGAAVAVQAAKDPESGAIGSAEALADAAELTARIEQQERRLDELRAARLVALRAATSSVPVAAVAARLKMSRQRVYKLLQG